MILKHLDLFSGIGGFSLAARWALIETVGFSEIDPFCCQVLQKNFENVPNFGDIKNLINPPLVDIITAGIPCQPFSIAGKRKGKDDERHLYYELSKIILLSKPNWVVIENVIGIVDMELENIIDDLESKNYKIRSYIIPACSANAPHRRDRIWIIANFNGKRCDDGIGNRKIGFIQENIERNMASLQQKWTQLKPISWETNSARNWLEANTEDSRKHNGIYSKLDKDRLKSLGNAIVPQIAYVFLKLIKEINDEIQPRKEDS